MNTHRIIDLDCSILFLQGIFTDFQSSTDVDACRRCSRASRWDSEHEHPIIISRFNKVSAVA